MNYNFRLLDGDIYVDIDVVNEPNADILKDILRTLGASYLEHSHMWVYMIPQEHYDNAIYIDEADNDEYTQEIKDAYIKLKELIVEC